MPLSPGCDPDVSIYYECSTFGRESVSNGEAEHRVLWIAGVGCAQDVWEKEIAIMEKLSKLKGGLSVCTFDNRGIGRSSSPVRKGDYSIEKLAGDALALLGHLKWSSAHIIGHSMGSMIATRIAIVAPDMVDSLTLIATCRRFVDLWPRSFKSLSLFLNMFLSPLDAEGRALLDLKCHFTQDYLEETLTEDEVASEQGAKLTEVNVDVMGSGEEKGGVQQQRQQQLPLTRRESLKREYMRKASMKNNHQPDHGFKGQMNACRCHFVSMEEIESLRETDFPFLMIHGTQDYIIPWQAGQKFFLMLKNRSKFMLLHGAHFLSRERTGEVVTAVLQQIFEGWNLRKKRESRVGPS